MIDSHCHITLNQDDIEELMLRASQTNVKNMLSVACSWDEYDDLINILNKYSNIYGAFGIHPEYCKESLDIQNITKRILSHPRIIAVGECGLDYHYTQENIKQQRVTFEDQIEISSSVGKPIIVHTREADEDTIGILQEAYRGNLLKNHGVIHCFSGTKRLAEKALDLGFYISASGIITFKNAEDIRSIFKEVVPLDHILVETDSPYMAPIPYRGRTNEPSFVIKTAEKLAEIKNCTLDNIDEYTTRNFYNLFKIKDIKNAN